MDLMKERRWIIAMFSIFVFLSVALSAAVNTLFVTIEPEQNMTLMRFSVGTVVVFFPITLFILIGYTKMLRLYGKEHSGSKDQLIRKILSLPGFTSVLALLFNIFGFMTVVLLLFLSHNDLQKTTFFVCLLISIINAFIQSGFLYIILNHRCHRIFLEYSDSDDASIETLRIRMLRSNLLITSILTNGAPPVIILLAIFIYNNNQADPGKQVPIFLFFAIVAFVGIPAFIFQALYSRMAIDRIASPDSVIPEAISKIEFSKDVIRKYDISRREEDIIKMVARGLSNKDIAKELFISIFTVKNHLFHIYKKLDVKTRSQIPGKLNDNKVDE
ncbi:MAG: response regulator transcription factor [Brevinematales bacterium]|nr:response regulator transcription factor [Brevinematales bacterium]